MKSKVYMLRTRGIDPGIPGQEPREEGKVYDVPKAEAEKLVADGIAEEFDGDNKLHAAAPEGEVPKKKAAAAHDVSADVYDTMTLDQLHKEAADRNIEGRSQLTNKELLLKALKKDDHAKGKK